MRRSRAGWPRDAPAGRSRRPCTGLVEGLASVRQRRRREPTAVNTARGLAVAGLPALWSSSNEGSRRLVSSFNIGGWADTMAIDPPLNARGHPDPVSPRAGACSAVEKTAGPPRRLLPIVRERGLVDDSRLFVWHVVHPRAPPRGPHLARMLARGLDSASVRRTAGGRSHTLALKASGH